MKSPLLIAHSGFADTKPNSLASVAAASQAGADGVEFDVQCSADGAPVLAHDPLVVSPGGLERHIAALPATSIGIGSFMVPGIAESPPALVDVIETCRDAGLLLNLDVKDLRALPAIRQLLFRTGYTEESFLTGCGIEEIKDAGRAIPEISLLVNVESEESLDAVVRIGAQGINVEHSLLTPSFVRAARRRFLSVAVWTVDDSEELQRMESLGVDSVTSNRPTRLKIERPT